MSSAARIQFRPGKRFWRGQLAKLLGVEPREVRWIPGVLDEVHTRFGTLYEFQRAFMTRTQVARRLGKSKSAIVAIEGKLLHPEMGPGDVRLFDVDDVEELVGKPLGDTAHSEWLKERKGVHRDHSRRRTTPSPTPQATANMKELERLKHENAALREMLLEHVEVWTRVRLASGQRELQGAIDQMLAEHLAMLGDDVE